MFAINIGCMGCALCWSTIFAYYATFVTDRVSTVGFTAYDCNWFDYPVELRKYIILIIARSQQPAEFTGLKLFQCTLDVFGKVNFQTLNAISSLKKQNVFYFYFEYFLINSSSEHRARITGFSGVWHIIEN